MPAATRKSDTSHVDRSINLQTINQVPLRRAESRCLDLRCPSGTSVTVRDQTLPPLKPYSLYGRASAISVGVACMAWRGWGRGERGGRETVALPPAGCLRGCTGEPQCAPDKAVHNFSTRCTWHGIYINHRKDHGKDMESLSGLAYRKLWSRSLSVCPTHPMVPHLGYRHTPNTHAKAAAVRLEYKHIFTQQHAYCTLRGATW